MILALWRAWRARRALQQHVRAHGDLVGGCLLHGHDWVQGRYVVYCRRCSTPR